MASIRVNAAKAPSQLRTTLHTALLWVYLIVSVCATDSWPFIRGPDFNGHSGETGLADHWPDDGPPVLWTRKLGQGYSAFVADGNRAYTQAQNMTGQFVYCLEADTGKTIWEYRYDWPYETAGVYPGPRSTPTLYDARVFFTSPDGLLACLDERDGELIWSVDLLQTYGIEGCDFGYACSPTVTDDLVILPVGGTDAGVVAFSAKTGGEIWRSTSQPASYTSAYPVELAGEPLVVCYVQNAVLILDRKTGMLRREIALSHGYDEHSAWPIYKEPLLWLSGPFRAGSYVLDLTKLDDAKTDLDVVWRSKTLSNDVCSSVLVDDHIYGFDIFDVQSKTHRPSRGIFRCVNFNTGEEKWSVGTGRARRTSNAEEYANDILQSGIIVADGKLVILNELGELILLKADPAACSELARCSILSGELTWTPPCLHRGRLYVRNQSQAMCVYLGDPAKLIDVPTMRAGDLPQHQYYDLAALILAVEPEYAFDIPHNRWLKLWFLTGVGLLIFGKLLAAAFCRTEASDSRRNLIEFIAVSFLGAAGTTVLGRLSAEFVFTWEVCLFAGFEYVAKPSTTPIVGSKVAIFLRRRLPLLAFLTISVSYFLVCRRLSLVFEWAFLIGFIGALPIVWLTNRFDLLRPQRLFFRLLISVLGFSCFFATAVAFLRSRY